MKTTALTKLWLRLQVFACTSALIFVLCVPVAGFSQAGGADSLQRLFVRADKQQFREKVFLHTDKTFYLTGETIWFKAYVVDAETHRPMAMSKVLYVELLNDESVPVLQAMIPLEQGLGDGSFVLPPSLNTGMFQLRAYTAWMKNFAAEFFFTTAVEVVNTTRRPDWRSLEKKAAPVARFYPEGGNLVQGLQSKIGFELLDSTGSSSSGSGVVLNNANDTVLRFETLKFGLGSFDFTPQMVGGYKALIRLQNGATFTASLPDAAKSGWVMHVQESGPDQWQVAAATSDATDEKLYLLAQNQGRFRLIEASPVRNGMASWLLDKKMLGEGVTSFTILDEQYRAVAERLVFQKPSHRLPIDAVPDVQEYRRRAPVNLQVQTAGDSAGTTVSNLSVSVFLVDSLQPANQVSIDEYLWLLSELKGRIDSPSYYFLSSDPQSDRAADNLMLTHGWRRIVSGSPALPASRLPRFLPDYEGAVISASVVNRLTGEPVPDQLCYLSAPGETFFASNAVSDDRGALRFVTKDIYGPVDLVLQAGSADSTLRLDLNSPYSDQRPPVPLPPFRLKEEWREQLRSRHLGVQLAHAFATPASQVFYVPAKRDSSVFYGTPDSRYRLDEYTRFPTMEEVMREIVAEVHLSKESGQFQFSVLNLPYKMHFGTSPLVLLDGVPVFNTGKLLSFDPLKIKAIDVVARKYYWGNSVNNGIISYRSYDGNLAGFELDPEVLVLAYNGLQVKREFYAPTYETAEQAQSREPDRRNLLLWKPSLQTDQNGTSTIRFYTSDLPGRYAVHIQGVSGSGLSGSSWVQFDVK